MNATRAAWPEYRTESPAYREERPTQFRPDLRVVRTPAPIFAADALSSVVPSHVQDPPLRLTRRGRIVVAVMAALLVAGLSLAVAGAAQATGHSTASRGGSPNLTRVVVHPGQTLWSVAQNADPNADPRQIIQQIAQLNALTSQNLAVGQQLWVPRS